MMDYIDFSVYMTNKRRKTQQQADDLWLSLLRDPSVKKDFLGKGADDNPAWRIAYDKGDFLLDSESLEYGKRMVGECSKVKKATEQQVDGMFDRVVTDHMSHDDEYFKQFKDGSLTDNFQEPLALRDSKGKAVVKLTVGPEDKVAKPAKPEATAKAALAIASAKTNTMAQMQSAFRDEETVQSSEAAGRGLTCRIRVELN